jgi:choline dehydrogenase
MIKSSSEFLSDRTGTANSFDYIVCGTGSSGSALAARLSERGSARILVLEAGGDDGSDLIGDPNRWPMTLGTELDWQFVAEPSAHLEGRAIPYSMGKVLGGGSSINVSTWSRGHKADWDYFAAAAEETAWSYDSVLDLYGSVEAWGGEPDQLRGRRGTMHIQPAGKLHPFSLAVLEAAEAAGLPRFPNANGRMMEAAQGCSVVDETVLGGRRQSVYRAYLHPRQSQANVTVVTNIMVSRILFEGRRAVGVECVVNGQTNEFRAEAEVILCLGAINTPRVLMQSGIGDADHLRPLGIRMISHLPAVGHGLHDHVSFGCVWGAGVEELPAAPRSQVACFWKTDEGLDSPNAYAYSKGGPTLTPENAARFSPPESAWTLMVGVRLEGRGKLRLTGTDIRAPLHIETGFLSEPGDLARVVAAAERARDIGNQQALAAFRSAEIAPGSLPPSELETFLRRGLGTFWHQSGTARMGGDPANSVVDGRLRVHGVEGLRVADASVLPRVTSGNTMAPCVVVGELAAKFILADSLEGVGERRDECGNSHLPAA